MLTGLTDIHESEDAEEEDEEGVGEGGPLGGKEVLEIGVEDNLIARGRARGGSRCGAIDGVSSSE